MKLQNRMIHHTPEDEHYVPPTPAGLLEMMPPPSYPHAPITSLCMGEGGTRLLWTGDARGEVRSWTIAPEGGSTDYFTPLAERF